MVYRVSYGTLLAGRLTRTRTTRQDSYALRSELESAGVARWLGNDRLIEQSLGTRDQGLPVPGTYHFVDERKDRDYRYSFDHQQRLAITNHPGGDIALEPGSQDEVSVLWALRIALKRGDQVLTAPVISGSKGRIYTHRYEVVASETVEVPAGTYETVKVTRQTSRQKYRMTFWCTPELDYAPIRVSRLDDKGREVTMELETYLPAREASPAP